MSMEINDSKLRRSINRQKKHDKKKNGMRVDGKSIFVLEEQKVKKSKKDEEK